MNKFVKLATERALRQAKSDYEADPGNPNSKLIYWSQLYGLRQITKAELQAVIAEAEGRLSPPG
jgi:hypothetical protein